MLRVFLIVAVAASLAAAVVGYLRVGGKISELSTELASTRTQRDQYQASEAKLKRDLRETSDNLAQSTAELAAVTSDLEVTQTRAAQQEVRANQLEQERNTYLRERNEAQTELAVWQAFNRTPDEIRALIAENRRLVVENNAITEENRVLGRKIDTLQAKVDLYEGRRVTVELRPDLRGQVIAVDPKYEFIVLNIGEEDGVLERGEMLVNRSGKLVAKVRILSVEPRRSVANVLPNWKQAEVMEGDSVIVGM